MNGRVGESIKEDNTYSIPTEVDRLGCSVQNFVDERMMLMYIRLWRISYIQTLGIMPRTDREKRCQGVTELGVCWR